MVDEDVALEEPAALDSHCLTYAPTRTQTHRSMLKAKACACACGCIACANLNERARDRENVRMWYVASVSTVYE